MLYSLLLSGDESFKRKLIPKSIVTQNFYAICFSFRILFFVSEKLKKKILFLHFSKQVYTGRFPIILK